jgi:hypothetical protein
VHVTDGGPGDLDGVADGACDFALTACLGTAACAPEPVQRVRVSVRGKPINAYRATSPASSSTPSRACPVPSAPEPA